MIYVTTGNGITPASLLPCTLRTKCLSGTGTVDLWVFTALSPSGSKIKHTIVQCISYHSVLLAAADLLESFLALPKLSTSNC